MAPLCLASRPCGAGLESRGASQCLPACTSTQGSAELDGELRGQWEAGQEPSRGPEPPSEPMAARGPQSPMRVASPTPEAGASTPTGLRRWAARAQPRSPSASPSAPGRTETSGRVPSSWCSHVPLRFSGLWEEGDSRTRQDGHSERAGDQAKATQQAGQPQAHPRRTPAPACTRKLPAFPCLRRRSCAWTIQRPDPHSLFFTFRHICFFTFVLYFLSESFDHQLPPVLPQHVQCVSLKAREVTEQPWARQGELGWHGWAPCRVPVTRAGHCLPPAPLPACLP